MSDWAIPIDTRATSPRAAASPSSASPIGGRSFDSGSAKPELGSHGRFVVTLRVRWVPAFALKSARRPCGGVASRGRRPVDGCSGVLFADVVVAVTLGFVVDAELVFAVAEAPEAVFALAAAPEVALVLAAAVVRAFARVVFAAAVALAVVDFAFAAAVVFARVVPEVPAAFAAVRFAAVAFAVAGFAFAAAVVFAAVARPVAGFLAAGFFAAEGFVVDAFVAAGLDAVDFDRAELAAGFFAVGVRFVVVVVVLAAAASPVGVARRLLRLVGRPAGRFARTSLLSGSAMRRFLHARSASSAQEARHTSTPTGQATSYSDRYSEQSAAAPWQFTCGSRPDMG